MMSDPAVHALVSAHKLQPHPEGGWFARTYTSPISLRGDLPAPAWAPGSTRETASSILYLLEGGGTSRLHRIKADELWFFHAGGPLTVAELRADGSVARTALGLDAAAGQRAMHVVRGGTVFGAYVEAGVPFALVSCVVTPSFHWQDWEMPGRSVLLAGLPPTSGPDGAAAADAAKVICRLTPPDDGIAASTEEVAGAAGPARAATTTA
jgi:predicted cupin superfamily sugar epimerase